MTKLKIAINGFGRIGRLVFRVLDGDPDSFDVVAVNDLGAPAALANLLRYDSVQGRFQGTVEVGEDRLITANNQVRLCQERDPRALPWKELGVDVVIESTGFFRRRASGDKAGYDSHIAAGARRVVISAPAKDTPDLTVVMGVNDASLTAEHLCISNASCTTNCLAPMAKVLHDSFGLASGLLSTVHAYTNDQMVTDGLHSDPRRSRAAACNIIPTTTGAATAVGLVLPELAGRLDGISLRVPVPAGSVTDLVVQLERDASVEAINDAMEAASKGPLAGVLGFTRDPIVSSDIIGDPRSCIFDASWTMQIAPRVFKVLGWYDNEFGYSNRTVDLARKLGAFL